MEQYTENQYDDDLTDSSSEYDDSYYTGAEDLFDYTPDEESPISRLKSLVLSIDWEITDEVLLEFNEELIDLKDIWAGQKIQLIYVQALEKLSKYIYQKKAESHPSAIKLLLTLYHNLEKIVSSDNLSDAEKKAILVEDVKRFENLKSHLKTPSATKTEVDTKTVGQEAIAPPKNNVESELLNLKAIVLGIDWEITDDDLSALRNEVVRLENLFAGSRPRLILLQGIGTIGAYIKVKKSDSHADAFKVLHLFYDSLEKIVDTPMSVEEEKAVLFPAVERFNSFKSVLGETISPESINRSEQINEGESAAQNSGAVTPAFSDLPEDETIGFQADKEAAALGIENPDNVNDHVANFFGEDSFVDERELSEVVQEEKIVSTLNEPQFSEPEDINENIALQGVDVEEGDEEETDSNNAPVAPALSFNDEANNEGPVAQVSDSSDDQNPIETSDVELEDDSESIEVMFPDDDEDELGTDFSTIDKTLALQGVDVESEADDDSDEDALPLLQGKLAPALADNDEVSAYNAEILSTISEKDHLDDEIADTVLDFFEEDDENVVPPVEDESFILDENLSLEAEETIINGISDADEEKDLNPMPVALDDLDANKSDEVSLFENDKQEEDLSSDIEGQLDDFFGSDEGTNDDVLNQINTSVETGAQSLTELQENADEEEVVFELVEEDIPVKEAVETPEGVAADAAISGVLTDDGLSISETDSTLDGLAVCIEATGLEVEDNVLKGLHDEINSVEQKWNDKPIEKTFLHLLRAITCHIERYRYEAGSDAYELLKSVFDALVLSQKDSDAKNNLLFIQTVRVLDWQQGIISNDALKSEDTSVMSDSLFVQELGNTDDQMLTFDDDLLSDNDSLGTNGSESGNLEDEISNLRKSLQDEISVLKKGKTDE